MELYKVYFEEETEGELYGISIVDDPANKYEFLALSEEFTEIELKASDKEKKTLTGVVLIPNQKITRYTKDRGYFQIYFEDETIERVSQDFFKKGYQRNSTYNHLDDLWLKGTTVVESWIVEDPNNDKSSALGFKNLPKGTWMITMKLSDELWDEYIKTGKAKGFSVDAYMQLEKVQLNNLKLKQEKMSLLKELIKLVSKTEQIQLASIEIEGVGTLTADAFEIGNVVFQEIEGEMVEAKSISFNHEGFVFMTDEKGEIVSKDEFVEEIPTYLPAEDSATEEEEDVAMEDETPSLEDFNELKAEKDALEAEFNALKDTLKEKETEVLELKRLPASLKLKANNTESTKSKASESTLEAISRITNSKQK